jgi:Ner family transcriptional regulator
MFLLYFLTMNTRRHMQETVFDVMRDPPKRRAWIIFQLSLKGLSMAAVGREAGVGRQAVYRVFDAQYPRMEQVLATALGVTPQFLFPERFDKDGKRLSGRGLQKNRFVTLRKGRTECKARKAEGNEE